MQRALISRPAGITTLLLIVSKGSGRRAPCAPSCLRERSATRPTWRPRQRLVLLALAVTSCAALAADPAPVWPTADWTESTPEAQGMAPSALADLVDFGSRHAMDSVLVERHGKVVLDAQYAPFKPGMKHVVNSVTKAVVSTLVGIAYRRGKTGPLDSPVLDFFPERGVANVDPRKKTMTLQNLLDSNAGLSWQEPLTDESPESMLQMERSPDWIGFVLDRPMAQAPGAGFNYNSGAWHLLSAILSRRTGVDTLSYARKELFAPLGIADVTWRRDPQGIPIGGYGLLMHPRDMVKIGYLYLHGGQWDGRQLLPAEWPERVFHPQVDMHLGSLRYANGWWSIPEKRAYMAVGFLRQLIVVLPDIDTVAVVTGRAHYPFGQLIDRIAEAARSPGPLPADPIGSARLADRVAAAGVETRSPVAPAPALAAAISGKTFRFPENRIGLQSIKLDLTAAEPSYETTLAAAAPNGAVRRLQGPIGLDGLFRVREARDMDPVLAVKGSWVSDNSFQVIARSLLEGIVVTYVLTFNGSQVDLALEDNSGVRARLRGVAGE